MTSTRKIESNKRNASCSTGPRTAGGKLRSRNNARRHGLATRLEGNCQEREGIACLAAVLVEGSDDLTSIEQSCIFAECHFDLRRIRTALDEVFATMSDLENVSSDDLEAAVRAIDSIRRYERRALSKRRQALRRSNDGVVA
jgi:hypothetical protein